MTTFQRPKWYGDQNTLGNQAWWLLANMAKSCGISLQQAFPVFNKLSSTWADRHIDSPPPWCSVTHDMSPIEYSIAMDSTSTELRFLTEPQGSPASHQSYWSSSLACVTHLKDAFGVSLARFHAIKDLYASADDTSPMAMPLAACFGTEGNAFKMYLCPTDTVDRSRLATVGETFARLGHGQSFKHLLPWMMQASPKLVCLDLSSSKSARFKLYVSLQDSSWQELEPLVTYCRERDHDTYRYFYKTFQQELGDMQERMFLSYTFVDMEDPVPLRTAWSLAPTGTKASDAQTLKWIERIAEYCTIDTTPLTTALHNIYGDNVQNTLMDSQGLISFVSLQFVKNRPRLTVYLCPCFYQARYGRLTNSVSNNFWPSPVMSAANDSHDVLKTSSDVNSTSGGALP